MASASRSGAGGKITTSRRKQRLAASPYDRPPPPASLPPKSPNWFTGVFIPSARALASGAGKILSSAIFSDSGSSSSEDVDSASEDGADNVNEHGIPDNSNLNVKLMSYGQESSLVKNETKRMIEQLIAQETFSREESDRLIEVLKSRVLNSSTADVEKRSLANSPGKMIDHEDVDIFNKAVLEAKQWFQEKKTGASSGTELAHQTIDLYSTGLKHVQSRIGSPVDVARSYLRERPLLASPLEHAKVRTPITTPLKLFNEGTSYSVNYDPLSSSKRWNSRTFGSWDLQEELRRVRSKATEDMLRSPPTKVDPFLFAVPSTGHESSRADEVVSGMKESLSEPDSFRKTGPLGKLMDVGVSSDPALIALESRQNGEISEAPSCNPSASGNNKDTEAVKEDGESATLKFPYSTSLNHAGEHHSDPQSSERNGSPAAEQAEFGEQLCANGLSSAEASLSAGASMVQKSKQYDEENHNVGAVSEKKSMNTTNMEDNCELLTEACMEVPIVTETDNLECDSGAVSEKSMNTTNMEDNCELLTEACMEVPIITETDSFECDYKNSLDMQHENLSQDMNQASVKGKSDILIGKQMGRKSSRPRR